MIAFPHAKINIGLNVISRREDGFHDIETVYYPVRWHDAVELIPEQDSNARSPVQGSKVRYSESGITLDIPPEKNLCVRAYSLLDAQFGLPSVKMHLHKTIPSGAGLGGGSSDAVQVLQLCNRVFGLGLQDAELKGLALGLGSDCPFFLSGMPALAQGRGERLSRLELNLAGLYVLIAKPPRPVDTAWAYSQVTPARRERSLGERVLDPPSSWPGMVTNDFEPAVFDAFPETRKARDRMYELGAVFAALTGSGSAVYGLFENPVQGNGAFPGMITWSGILD